MVWCEGGGVPTVAHKGFGLADRQAEKLAHRLPGMNFHVLTTTKIYKVELQPDVILGDAEKHLIQSNFKDAELLELPEELIAQLSKPLQQRYFRLKDAPKAKPNALQDPDKQQGKKIMADLIAIQTASNTTQNYTLLNDLFGKFLEQMNAEKPISFFSTLCILRTSWMYRKVAPTWYDLRDRVYEVYKSDEQQEKSISNLMRVTKKLDTENDVLSAPSFMDYL